MVAVAVQTRNQLLLALSVEVRCRLLDQLRPHPLKLKQLIYAQGGPMETVYFVETGMISMVVNFEDGMQAEVGLTGHEGMVGLPLLWSTDTSFVEAMVQMPGMALQMPAAAFRAALEASAELRTLLLRYNEARNAQTMQTAACNSRHQVEQRLARWLLMAHDRATSDELPLTQEVIAIMLGVRRPSVTLAAGALQRAGLVRHAAGRITIIDRAGLEAACCECYVAVRRRGEHVLGSSSAV
jgi:CRP-like cAMP-binding protein